MTLQETIRSYIPWNAQEESDRALMLQYMAQFPDLLTRANPMAHFTASAWVVSRDRRQVLMLYHNIYNSWSWAGGHADGEEDLLSVALREVREETGVSGLRPLSKQPLSLEIIAVPPHVKRGVHVSTHVHLNLTYLLEADETAPLTVKPDENSAVAWFPAEEAIARSTEPEMQVIYRKLMEKAAI